MRNCCHGEVGHETVLSVLDGRHRHALDRARSSEIRECTEICQSARYCFCFFSTVSVGGGGAICARDTIGYLLGRACIKGCRVELRQKIFCSRRTMYHAGALTDAQGEVAGWVIRQNMAWSRFVVSCTTLLAR